MTLAQTQFQQDILAGFSFVEATIHAIESSNPVSEVDKEARNAYVELYKQYCRNNKIKI